MEQPRRRISLPGGYSRTGLIIALLLLSVATTAWVLDAPNRMWEQQQQELRAARIRWQAQEITHYQLRLEREHFIGLPPIPPPCRQDARVVHGVISVIAQSDICNTLPLTVEDLFQKADALLQARTGNMTSGKSRITLCRTRSIVTITFHPELGYPLLLEQRVTGYPDWFRLQTWQIWFNTGHPPVCHAGLSGPLPPLMRYRVLELIPAP